MMPGMELPSDKVTKVPDQPSPRRTFLRSLSTLAARTGLAGTGLYAFHSLIPSRGVPKGVRESLGILRPPGALDEADFLALCIRCTRCSDSCEAHCIELFEPGTGNLQGTPYIDPHHKGCTLCLKCCETCPTGALQPMTEKNKVDMGDAVVDERLCVSHNGTGVCGACHTICPLKNRAITQDFRNRPTVHPDHCTGCGLCEEVCIVRDRRAIRVQSKRLWS